MIPEGNRLDAGADPAASTTYGGDLGSTGDGDTGEGRGSVTDHKQHNSQLTQECFRPLPNK